MKMPLDPQLSAELQELYLENKEWLSDILFLEDEMRFFQNLFDTVISKRVKKNHQQQVEVITTSLNGILLRRKHLKAILNARKKNLEQLLEGKIEYIGVELIEEDSAVIAEIRSLLATDKTIKKELFALIEELKAKDKSIALPVFLKIKRYPIF